MTKAYTKTFNVQGLNVLDMGDEWENVFYGRTTDIKVVQGANYGQPDYPVGFAIDDEWAGTPTQDVSEEMAPLINSGWEFELEVTKAEVCEDWSKVEKIDGEEYPRFYTVARVKVYGMPPNATPDQRRTYRKYKKKRDEKAANYQVYLTKSGNR